MRRSLHRLHECAFPIDSIVSDELSELHAELALYDGHVAGVATSVLHRAPVDPEWLIPDTELGERLQRAVREYEGAGRRDAEAYLACYRALDDLLRAAQGALDDKNA